MIALVAAGCAGAADEQDTAPPPSPAGAAPTTPQAEPRARPLSLQEVRWLHTIETLLPAMNKLFTDSPSDLTPAALTTLAQQVRGCSRTVTRLGVPSTRLQPVYALVKQACREYDKGATCFAHGARIGNPSRAAVLRELEENIDCGFAAAERGGRPLVAARLKAADIKASIR